MAYRLVAGPQRVKHCSSMAAQLVPVPCMRTLCAPPAPQLMPFASASHVSASASSQNARDYRYGHPPIHVRPASSQEGTAYLAQPAFSSCTVPIIW